MIPPQPVEKKPGQLEQWQLEQYFDKGFLVLPNFFSREELQPAIEVREYDSNTQLLLLMCLYSFGLLGHTNLIVSFSSLPASVST